MGRYVVRVSDAIEFLLDITFSSGQRVDAVPQTPDVQGRSSTLLVAVLISPFYIHFRK